VKRETGNIPGDVPGCVVAIEYITIFVGELAAVHLSADVAECAEKNYK